MTDPKSNQLSQQITQNISGALSAIVGSGGIATVNVNQPPLTPTAATAPAPPCYFKGRRQYLDALKAALHEGQTTALAALQGMGGIGKTATAQQLAAEVGHDFPGGIFWGSLPDHDGNPRPILRAWGRACAQDLSNEPDPNALANLVRNLLTARREEQGPLLVIVDDVRAEWLDAAQLLQRAIPTGAPLLLTTRDETLGVSLGAMIHRLEELSPDEALALLKAHAGAAIVEAELEAAEILLHVVGYLPLAIELAGKLLALMVRKPGYRLATLQQAVAQRAALTLSGHPGLTATFAISYEALPPAAQRVFRWLGVFATGPMQLTSIAGVLRLNEVEVEPLLDRLVSAALLNWGETEGMYSFHPLLQQYAQTLLVEAGEMDEARKQHVAYYLDFAQANAQIDPVAHNRLEEELLNLLQAVAVAEQFEVYETVNAFGNALYADSHFLDMRGYAREALDVLTKAITACQKIGTRVGEAGHLGNLANMHYALGEVKQAIKYHQRVLIVSREISHRQLEGISFGNLGLIYGERGQVEQAIEYYQQALTISREIDDRRSEAIHLSNLGNAYRDLGQIEQAIEYYQQALTISREIGDRRHEGDHLGNLGNAFRALRQHEKAIDYYLQALNIAREVGDRRGEAKQLNNLGNGYHILAQGEQAIEYYRQSLILSRKTGDRPREGKLLDDLGRAYRILGQVEQTIECHEQALAISREIGDRRNEGINLGNLGLAYYARGEVEQAIEYYQRALIIAHEVGNQDNEASWLGNLGSAHKALGQVEKSKIYLEQALVIFERIESANAEQVRKLLSDLGGEEKT